MSARECLSAFIKYTPIGTYMCTVVMGASMKYVCSILYFYFMRIKGRMCVCVCIIICMSLCVQVCTYAWVRSVHVCICACFIRLATKVNYQLWEKMLNLMIIG